MKPANFAEIDCVFRLVDRPVWIVTAAHDQLRSGLVATWVNQCSLDPHQPSVMAGLASNHFTTALVDASSAFCLHLITADQLAVAWQFCLSSGRGHDKFVALETRLAGSGSPQLANCLAWLDCRVIARYDTGDRVYFWADVLAGGRIAEGIPLTEAVLLAAADKDQKAVLRTNLLSDQALHRPLREQWLAGLPNRPGS